MLIAGDPVSGGNYVSEWKVEQLPKFVGKPRPSDEAKADAMPANDSLWFDDKEDFGPTRPEAA
jgi:hypothetical protein